MAASHPLVERFRTGDVPEPLKAAAARGALPLPPEDLVQILFHLRAGATAERLQDIASTLATLPADTIVAVARDSASEPAFLDFLARSAGRREGVIEAVVLNPATADPTVHAIAQVASADLLDLIGLNQVRLARAPAILQAMLANAALSLSTRRRLKEVWDLIQDEARRVPEPEPPREEGAPAAPAASVPAAATAAAPPARPVIVKEPSAPPGEDGPTSAEAASAKASEAAAETAPVAAEDLSELGELAFAEMEQRILDEMRAEEATDEQLRLAQRLLRMTVPEKVQLATMGDREARSVLIRDSSKMVQEAVVNSPKLTDSEIEKISNMRSLSEDIMRMIASSRDFTKNYSVAHNLVRNPKTPRPLAIGLMQRLQSRDLAFLVKDKNIPDVVRRQAKIIMDKRVPGQKK